VFWCADDARREFHHVMRRRDKAPLPQVAFDLVHNLLRLADTYRSFKPRQRGDEPMTLKSWHIHASPTKCDARAIRTLARGALALCCRRGEARKNIRERTTMRRGKSFLTGVLSSNHLAPPALVPQ
jgi:hypothetical protein